MKKLSFRQKLILPVCLINLSVICILTFLNYRWYSNLLISQTKSQTQQIVEQISSNINTYIDELYRLTLTPYYNDNVMNSLESSALTPSDSLDTKRIVEGFLASVMSLPRDEILRVYIMNDAGIYSYTRTPYEMKDYTNYLEQDWYKDAQETTLPIFIQPQLERVYGDKGTPIFSLVRILRSKNDNSKRLGVVKVDADFTGIRKICDHTDLDYDGILLIVNNQDEILYWSANGNSLFPKLTSAELLGIINSKSDSNYLVNRVDLEKCGISILALHSYKAITLPLQSHLFRSLGISIACIVIAAILFAFVIQICLKPLFKIIKLMKAVGSGDLNVHAEVEGNDEIGFLSQTFNNMTSELSESLEQNTRLTKEIYEAQYLAKEAQYNALYSQIKPHFLYNTLNTISLLIKCDCGNQAIKAIESFSMYLGGIMNSDREITISQELQICTAYLSIVELRYQDRLSYHLDISDSLQQTQIPALTIQPIVENAIKYACESQRKMTLISIYSNVYTDYFEIVVEDNGPGIAPQILEQINLKIAEKVTVPSAEKTELLGNLGLVNIARRLRLRFNDYATMRIESSTNGTRVHLRFPYQMKGENNNVSANGC